MAYVLRRRRYDVFALDSLLGISACGTSWPAAVAIVAIAASGSYGGRSHPKPCRTTCCSNRRCFLAALCAGVPIAFVLALSTLVYIWTGELLPGELFAQQMARGLDNFVLLAVPSSFWSAT